MDDPLYIDLLMQEQITLIARGGGSAGGAGGSGGGQRW